MEASYIKSLVFVIAYMYFYYSFLVVKKSEKQLNGVGWISITFVLSMWVNTMVAAVYSLINIPIKLLSMSLFYVLFGSILMYHSKKNGRQKYLWSMLDVVIVFVIAAIAFVISIKLHQYTLQIAYATSDPATHFKFALQVIETGSVKGHMFYAPLNNGLFIDVLSPFLEPAKYYKAFILVDIIMFALAGTIFYSIIRDELISKKQIIIGLVMTIVYMLGYPLNNKIYGFVHLGMAVAVIAVIIYILKLYLNGDISERITTVLLLLGCHAIVMCYMLFAPVVYFAVLAVIIIKNGKKFFSKKVILQCFQIFLLPCCLAIYYCYFEYMKAENLSVSATINLTGASYGDVYGNFVFFMPLVLYLCFTAIREKKHKEILTFFAFFSVFIVALLILVFLEKCSWYYFYKLYHVEWMIVCWITAVGVVQLLKRQKEMLYAYVLVIVTLVAIWYYDFNSKIITKEQQAGYAMANESSKYFSVGFDVYDFNRQFFIIDMVYSKEKMQLYNYAIDKLHADEKFIPMFVEAINATDAFWYHDIAGNVFKPAYPWYNPEHYANVLFEDKNADYVMIIYENPLYEEYQNTIESFDKVYENKAGCIIKID